MSYLSNPLLDNGQSRRTPFMSSSPNLQAQLLTSPLLLKTNTNKLDLSLSARSVLRCELLSKNSEAKSRTSELSPVKLNTTKLDLNVSPQQSVLLRCELLSKSTKANSRANDLSPQSVLKTGRPELLQTSLVAFNRLLRTTPVKRPLMIPGTKEKKIMPTKIQRVQQEIYVFESSFTDMPSYEKEFSRTVVAHAEIEEEFDISFFVEDAPISMFDEVNIVKKNLILAVSSSLIHQPNFKCEADQLRLFPADETDKLVKYCPEFLLKLALYCRRELNIRTTANFLLALAAFYENTRPFLKKYFKETVLLPSDWIEVAEMYHVMQPKGGLPAALRKVLVMKFPEFDQYQLGKYNKNKRSKKKPTEQPTSRPDRPSSPPVSSISDSEEEREEEAKPRTYNLKHLIATLHIAEPVENVMCLLGRRYPPNSDAFYLSRLPNAFDPQRAGKRMKLPVPETWETQLSSRGNKAEVWEELIDHKKLPFMAMLRNIRNMLEKGVSMKHHKFVLKKLCDKGAVVNSKQFPFRFYTAYLVIKDLEKSLLGPGDAKPGRGRRTLPQRKPPPAQKTKKKTKSSTDPPLYSVELLQQYSSALNKAIQISATHNVDPISGKTLIILNSDSKCGNIPCASFRAAKPVSCAEVISLMTSMCVFCCEDWAIVANGAQFKAFRPGTTGILEMTMELRDRAFNKHPSDECDFIRWLSPFIERRQHFDTILVFSAVKISSSLERMIRCYRNSVNPEVLTVYSTLDARSVSLRSQDKGRDFFFSGFSDQLLKFVAQRGDQYQLMHIDNIDKRYNLEDIDFKMSPPELERSLPVVISRSWKNFRVFISSTFEDMHSERDLLTRFVFPALREEAKKLLINLYEVDLRWGVTAQQSYQSVKFCLDEARSCDFFIGIIGTRYGHVPDPAEYPTGEEYAWMKDHPPGASITELEIYHAAVHNHPPYGALFLNRSLDLLPDLPSSVAETFISDLSIVLPRMTALEVSLTKSFPFVCYSCKWFRVLNGKAIVSGLEPFGQCVSHHLRSTLQKVSEEETCNKQVSSSSKFGHFDFASRQAEHFIGRKKLLSQCFNEIAGESTEGLFVIHGDPGSGKTAFVSKLAMMLKEKTQKIATLIHFVGLNESTTASEGLRIICLELQALFGLAVKSVKMPFDLNGLSLVFKEMLDEISRNRFLLRLFIDDVDLFEASQISSWVPDKLPAGIVLVFTAATNSNVFRSLKKRQCTLLPLKHLDVMDKYAITSKTLENYGKTLDSNAFNNQMRLLSLKQGARNTLYLILACQQLRTFGSYEQITEIINTMPHTISKLLLNFIEQLESEFGVLVVSCTLAFLVVLRHDIAENDLNHLVNVFCSCFKDRSKTLPLDEIGKKAARSPSVRVVPSVFLGLIRMLKGVLISEDIDTVRVTRSLFINEIKQRYFIGPTPSNMELKVHRVLACVFFEAARKNDKWVAHPLAYTELPYHLSCSGDFEHLKDILSDLSFIEEKCKLGLAHHLVEDFMAVGQGSRLLEGARRQFKETPQVSNLESFVTQNVHIFSKYPSLVQQQALNSTIPELNQAVDSRGKENVLCWLNKTDRSNAQTIETKSSVHCVACSPVGSYVACGLASGLVKIFNLNTGLLSQSIMEHFAPILCLCYVGKTRLCICSKDSTMTLWDTDRHLKIEKMKGHNRAVTGCDADQDGRTIVSVSRDGCAKVWDGCNGGFRENLKAEWKPINCVAIHPEGRLVVYGGWDNTVKLYDIMDMKRKALLHGHQSSIQGVAFHPSGKQIASASADGVIKLWSTTNAAQLSSFRQGSMVSCLKYTTDGDYLISSLHDSTVTIWGSSFGKMMWHAAVKEDQETVVCAMVVSLYGEGGVIFTGFHSGVLKKFQLATGVLLSEVQAHSMQINQIDFAEDYSGGSSVVTCSDDKTVLSWTTHLSQSDIEMKGFEKPVPAIAFDARTLLVADYCSLVARNCLQAKRIKEKKMAEPEVTRDVSAHDAPITSLVLYDEDQMRMCASGSRDGTVVIWTVKYSPFRLERMASVKAHLGGVTCLTVSSYGGKPVLVTGSDDFGLRKVRFGKDASNIQHVSLGNHDAGVNDVSGSDGFVSSASTDKTLRLWDLKGNELSCLKNTDRVNGCHMFDSRDLLDDDEDKEDARNTTWAQMIEDSEQVGEMEEPRDNLNSICTVAACDDGLSLWKPFIPNLVSRLTGHTDKLMSLAVTRSGLVCSASVDQSVRVWKCSEDELANRSHHDAPISGVALINDLVVSSSRDGVVKIWRQDSFRNLRLELEFTAHHDEITSLQALPRKDECADFITSSMDGHVVLWSYNPLSRHLNRTERDEQYDPILKAIPHGTDRTAFGVMYLMSSEGICGWKTRRDCYRNFDSTNRCWHDFAILPGHNCIASLASGNYVLDGRFVFPEDDVDAMHLCIFKTYIVCGRSKKNISIVSLRCEVILSVDLSVEVIGCCSMLDQYIVVSCNDGSVRVFDDYLKMVALFFCVSNVSTLNVFQDVICCGDNLGNLYFLKFCPVAGKEKNPVFESFRASPRNDSM